MDCNSRCPLGFALLVIPVMRVVDSQMQQSSTAQLPWWLWMIIVFVALTAIFWWQVYLRPYQAKDVQEMELHLGHGHDHHNPVGQHAQQFHTETIKPDHESSRQPLEINEQGNQMEAQSVNPDGEIASQEK